MVNFRNSRHDSSAPFSLPQKIVMIIIGLIILVVVVATIFALKFDTKFQVEAKIADLARDYYEKHFYPEAFDGTIFSPAAEEALSPYAEKGLSPVPLNQVLLTNPLVTESDRNFLDRYCDLSTTTVKFFPEAPYAADSYHTEISYSCNYK